MFVMKRIIALVFFFFADPTYADPRVIGGHDAPDGKYPYQVSLRGPRYLCGGSILNERWILTAAHCLEGCGHESVTVVAGTNLLQWGKGEVYRSNHVVLHENYISSDASYDIGLVRVSKNIEFNEKVQPIKLPKEDFYKVGHSVVLAGWGSTKLDGGSSNKLQEIFLRISDQQECVKAHRYPVRNSHICTLTKSGEGACHGDSGSPLIADGIQIGIASFVRPCAIGYPDVFTRVYSYLDWIAAEQVKNLD